MSEYDPQAAIPTVPPPRRASRRSAYLLGAIAVGLTAVAVFASSSFSDGLRHGLVNVYRRRQSSHKAQGTPLSRPVHPNELWCADYKGEFMLADRRYCYPLTVTDAASRYLICCEALCSTQASLAFTVFERLFKDFGLPSAIRTDNGVPFASPNSLFNLSKLSVWWLRLGIDI